MSTARLGRRSMFFDKADQNTARDEVQKPWRKLKTEKAARFEAQAVSGWLESFVCSRVFEESQKTGRLRA